MNSLKKTAIVCGYFMISMIVLHLLSLEALAADSEEGDRVAFGSLFLRKGSE